MYFQIFLWRCILNLAMLRLLKFLFELSTSESHTEKGLPSKPHLAIHLDSQSQWISDCILFTTALPASRASVGLISVRGMKN
jgi:hypothetical protein